MTWSAAVILVGEGAKGQKGLGGTNGAKGATGAKGAKGQKGLGGTNGAKGATGDKGATGAVSGITDNISTTGDIEAGLGSGGIALTANDGGGNANVTFKPQIENTR